MRISHISRYALGACAAAMLAGCGGSQPPIDAQGAMPQTRAERRRVRPAYSVLHNFGGSGDGSHAQAGLLNVNGTLYGTTADGGYNGEGTVYSITLSGSETVLHSFGADDGGDPEAGLVNVNGTLYGTTAQNGATGAGTVFSITTSGKETVLYSFGGKPDGESPLAGLVKVKNTLYGTTVVGGSGSCYWTAYSYYDSGCGTVFSMTPSGHGDGILHSFKGAPKDGAFPYAGLLNATGRLYGTTHSGGANDAGTVFSVTPSGKETVLYSFGNSSGDGESPEAGLIEVNGTLYGTTNGGGANGDGTVFALKPPGKETVLHSFGGSGDGESPEAGLIEVNGTLYGTTKLGGAYDGGTVFAITSSGKETVLLSFLGPDGKYPDAGLIHVKGTLYGTTESGGTNNGGTAFSSP